MTTTYIYLTVLSYLASMGLYLRFLYTGKETTGRWATVLLILGLAGHYAALLGR